MPPESVQQVVEWVPQRCQQCQRKLKGKDTNPLRHQVVELEPVKTVVTGVDLILSVGQSPENLVGREA